jgi:hypothetical protein
MRRPGRVLCKGAGTRRCPLETRRGGKGQDGDYHKAVITKGTAIAPTGNHAALYVSQDSHGLWVVDHYLGSNGIHKRQLRFKGIDGNGKFLDPSNNGDGFSVIE